MAEYSSVREVSGQSQMTPGYGWQSINSVREVSGQSQMTPGYGWQSIAVYVKCLDSHR